MLGYWSGEGKRSYHHTAPINSLYALHESLLLLKNEGLVTRGGGIQDMHNLLRDGLEKLGFEFVVKADARLPQLNTVYVPEGVDEAKVRSHLLEQYNLEIGGGLGEFSAGVANWTYGVRSKERKCFSLPEGTRRVTALKAVIEVPYLISQACLVPDFPE